MTSTQSQDINRDIGITSNPIDPAAALEFVSVPENGGICTFIGTVRNFNQGRHVVGISYDIFKPLARKSFEQILQNVNRDYGPAILYLRHAHGRLKVGDVAVVVAVGTRHRDEAFKACRRIIEDVKRTSPIWKQEHYADGDSAWVKGCALCHDDHHNT